MLSSSAIGALILVVLQLCASALRIPCDITAQVGENVTIPCVDTRAIVSAADWTFKPISAKVEIEICTGITCNSRYQVDRVNDFRLFIHGVQSNDSGRYTCITFDRFSEHRHLVQLCVLALRPIETLSHVAQQHSVIVDTTHSYPSTTSAISPLPMSSIDIPIVAVVIVVTIFVCLASAAAFGIIAYRIVRPKTRKRQQQLRRKAMEGKYSPKDKLLTMHEDSVKAKSNIILTATFEQLVSELFDARILRESFIFLFRDELKRQSNSSNSDNGRYELSAKCAFTSLATVSQSFCKVIAENSSLIHMLRKRLYYERSGYAKRPTRADDIQPLSANSPVMGVAVFGDSKFIIYKELSAICVINGELKMIVVKDMKSPVDIVACTALQRLFVADEESRCIWSVPVPAGDPIKWKVFNEATPKAMSISDSSLLVTTDTPVLFKYSSNGTDRIEVDLKEFTAILHAVETARSTIIACCRRPRGHQVVEFGFNGQELCRFVCETRVMRYPSYLAQHSDGRLLAADTERNRIVLLDTRLKLGGTTILNHQRDEICAPRAICIDETAGQLLIVNSSAHSIRRFAIS